MTQTGKLTKANAGYAMPVDAPLYAKPPIHYRFAETITISYETDGAAAANLSGPWAKPDPQSSQRRS